MTISGHALIKSQEILEQLPRWSVVVRVGANQQWAFQKTQDPLDTAFYGGDWFAPGEAVPWSSEELWTEGGTQLYLVWAPGAFVLSPEAAELQGF